MTNARGSATRSIRIGQSVLEVRRARHHLCMRTAAAFGRGAVSHCHPVDSSLRRPCTINDESAAPVTLREREAAGVVIVHASLPLRRVMRAAAGERPPLLARDARLPSPGACGLRRERSTSDTRRLCGGGVSDLVDLDGATAEAQATGELRVGVTGGKTKSCCSSIAGRRLRRRDTRLPLPAATAAAAGARGDPEPRSSRPENCREPPCMASNSVWFALTAHPRPRT